MDLSTGRNRDPWRGGTNAAPSAQEDLTAAAARWLNCGPVHVLPVTDPRAVLLRLPVGHAAVLGSPAAARLLRAKGWAVQEPRSMDAITGADLAVIANPAWTGQEWQPSALAHLAGTVGRLVVDESLADPRPDLSLAPALPANAMILRDLRPFWGVDLGLVLAPPDLKGGLDAVGPVDEHHLHRAAQALSDRRWADDITIYLTEATLRLDRIAARAGWRMAGGTHLFRLYDTGDAQAAQLHLARRSIWTRRASAEAPLLQMDIPTRPEWDRIRDAFRGIPAP